MEQQHGSRGKLGLAGGKAKMDMANLFKHFFRESFIFLF